MPRSHQYAAVVVGSGPNGLAAAIRLAQANLPVLVMEAAPTVGGGVRSEELTLPGFVHDVCSAVHPLAAESPFFSTLPLQDLGLSWVHPAVPLAHPLPNGGAGMLKRDLAETSSSLGDDGHAYLRLMEPILARWTDLIPELLRPILHFPRHPALLASFGCKAVRSADGLARSWFQADKGRALFAGLCAHSCLSLDQMASASFGLVLGACAHASGWPFPKGGAQKLSDALAIHLRSLGGQIAVGEAANSLDELPPSEIVMLDVAPRTLLKLAGTRLPARYRARLERFRLGPGVFKLDYALSHPIPWQASECAEAGVVHVGGSLEEVERSETLVADGKVPDQPFVLVSQPSLFDPSRAPSGKHVAWAYCHVPNGCDLDMTLQIENQIERFAPGFRDCVLARHRMNCSALERHNSNCIGGDITGGANDVAQLVSRPYASACPYRTPLSGVFLCSASTPPGGGVHGMCGFHAAEAALRRRG